jgi:hypothetical protein
MLDRGGGDPRVSLQSSTILVLSLVERQTEMEKMATSTNAEPAGFKVRPSMSSPLDSLDQMQQLKQDAVKARPSVVRYIRQMTDLNRRTRRLNQSSSSTRPASFPGATRIQGVINNDTQVPPPAENNYNDNNSPFIVEAQLVKEEEVTQAQVVTHRVHWKRWVILLLILGVTIYIVYSIVDSEDSEDNDSSSASPSLSPSSSLRPSASPSASHSPSASPSLSPSSSLSPTASPSASPSINRLGVLQNLLEPKSTQGDAAVVWLANEDSKVLPLDTSEEIFRNRYALVVFYNSTNRTGWNDNYNWFSESSVCFWRSESKSTGNYLGVTACRVDGIVSGFGFW